MIEGRSRNWVEMDMPSDTLVKIKSMEIEIEALRTSKSSKHVDFQGVFMNNVLVMKNG